MDALKELQAMLPKHRPECGWTKLFHPKGVQVTLPVTGEPLDYAAMLANVSAMLDAGFLVQAPGLEEGEMKEWCQAIVKGYTKKGSPRLDLYRPDDKHKFIVAYGERDDEVEAFEFATKLKLDAMPEYVGVGHLERGVSPQTDKLFVTLASPLGFVWKPNPKYKDPPAGEDTRTITEKTKRLFVHWADQKPTAPAPEPVTLAGKPLPDNNLIAVEVSYFTELLTNPKKPLDMAGLNAETPRLKQMQKQCPPAFTRCWKLVTDYAVANGWRYDNTARSFVTTAERVAQVNASLAKAKQNMQDVLAKVPPVEDPFAGAY
jgi:hypothetical protein